MDGTEVFLPRVRFKRATRQGMAWATEALFPGYLFVRFDWQKSLRQVRAASGVRGVVRFGDQWPVVPEQVIQELQKIFGASELNTINPELTPGDSVRIGDGTFRGLLAVVSQVMPQRERVSVLMDFLGRQTMIELKSTSILKEGNDRATIFSRTRHCVNLRDGLRGLKWPHAVPVPVAGYFTDSAKT